VTDPASLADATLATLLAVRLRGTAETPAIEATLATMALTVEDPQTLLGRLELAGLLELRDGPVPRWRLTADGRAEGERLMAVELDRRNVREAVTHAYDLFIARNGALLRACTAWQLVDANPSSLVTNEHTDAAYDEAVIERLRSIHEAVLPICGQFAAALDRLASYGPRFTAAMRRIDDGDVDAFDSPGTDSYHAIWFELHENLLATLGRDRSTEPLP